MGGLTESKRRIPTREVDDVVDAMALKWGRSAVTYDERARLFRVEGMQGDDVVETLMVDHDGNDLSGLDAAAELLGKGSAIHVVPYELPPERTVSIAIDESVYWDHRTRPTFEP